MKPILTRTLTALIAVPIILSCTYFGGIPFLLLVLVLALISINEFYHLMKIKGYNPSYIMGNFFLLFFIVFAYYALKKNWEPAHSAILTLAVMVALSSGVFFNKTKNTIVDTAVTILGMVYIGWFFSYLIFIRSLTLRGGVLFFLIITIWANDIVAYLVGSLIGRTKLNPVISPKKTLEGSIAGFITCIIAGAVFRGFSGIPLFHALALGAMIGVISQISDLVESLIKRDVGVKDSGNIVPGHGGVLDRMDSFILTAPVMYYYVVWFVF